MFFNFFKKEPRPFNEGFLSVGNGHEIHYMEFGNPNGQVIIRFHGGPGGSTHVGHALSFDLKTYRVILFDQRGCGQSKFTDLLSHNTTIDTLSDTEKLLQHLKIPMKELIVSGSSFGATLALLFAEKNPKSVQTLLLSSVFLARKQDLTWTDNDSRLFYPDLMYEMKKALQSEENLLDGYNRLLFSGNYEQMKTALKYYGSYEFCLGKTDVCFKDISGLTDKRINAMKIFLTYEQENIFLTDNQILKNIATIKHIPTLIVHNRLDMTCPIIQAWDLSQALDNATLIINPNIGHSSSDLKKCFQKQVDLFLKKQK